MCISGTFFKQTKGVTYKAWRYWGISKELFLGAAHHSPSGKWKTKKYSTRVVSNRTAGDKGLHSTTHRPLRRYNIYGRVLVSGTVSIFCQPKQDCCPTCGTRRSIADPERRNGYLSSRQEVVSLVVPKRLYVVRTKSHYDKDGIWQPEVQWTAKEIAAVLRKRYKVTVKVV